MNVTLHCHLRQPTIPSSRVLCIFLLIHIQQTSTAAVYREWAFAPLAYGALVHGSGARTAPPCLTPYDPLRHNHGSNDPVYCRFKPVPMQLRHCTLAAHCTNDSHSTRKPLGRWGPQQGLCQNTRDKFNSDCTEEPQCSTLHTCFLFTRQVRTHMCAARTLKNNSSA